MAEYTDCQTPNAIYDIGLDDADGNDAGETDSVKTISCKVTLPRKVRLPHAERELLEKNLHNALELVLARYFVRKR